MCRNAVSHKVSAAPARQDEESAGFRFRKLVRKIAQWIRRCNPTCGVTIVRLYQRDADSRQSDGVLVYDCLLSMKPQMTATIKHTPMVMTMTPFLGSDIAF